MAVHSTSKRKVALLRRYQMTSVCSSASSGTARDERQVGALLDVGQLGHQRAGRCRAASAPTSPTQQRRPRRWPYSTSWPIELGVLGVAGLQLVVRAQQVGRRGPRSIAVQAGADERLVGRVVAPEHRRDAVEEGRLRQAAGGREEAEDGPLDAVREGQRGGRDVALVAQPPAPVDLLEAAPGRRAAAPRR